ncbi:hypothetical protein GH5_00890 [Leishmania sp. Ghana 2012 LV757]|uniref:Short chain dehydrogenase n=1 Tax=Leishmania orientalis TaxID=2249476 RepID=A0A836FNR4_9TRYP|nr:hypothetical protein LSCM4_01294 [Leishmania orientalis]KAG5491992.1 hypothetical protein GH5_00890 [Leishmania sp. Ghana 2012 LV757]
MKSVFITGGNRGIGLETAIQLSKLGYYVIISCRDEAQAKAALEKVPSEGTKAGYVIMDVMSETSVARAAAEVSKMVNGVLDVLINNAGYAAPSGDMSCVNLDEMRKCYEVNVIGAVCVTNHFLDMVKKSPAGRIVNVGSIMGSCQLGVASLRYTPYNCSKAALNMYTVNLASSLKDTNVKANCAHPGWVKTEMGGPEAPLEVTEGAETSVYLATLPDDGPTGGFFYKRERLPW